MGEIELSTGLPTRKGIEQLFEIQDFQRATQLYQREPMFGASQQLGDASAAYSTGGARNKGRPELAVA